MTDYAGLLRTLSEGGVEFIVIGGLAAVAHGAGRATFDVDVVYRRNPENLRRIVEAFGPHRPYPRGAPQGLPFLWDTETLRRGLNFTLATSLGDIDLLGEIAGGGHYEDLAAHAQPGTVQGVSCQVLGLRKLIEAKRAAGRPKDFEAIAELEAILEEKGEL